MAIQESTHWYSPNGDPAYTVIGANGNERATTLRDARKLNLVPSVTTIIGVAAKPGLENWKIDQALMSALTLPKGDDESLDEFMKRAKQDAKEQSYKAAERGTEIHAEVESGFSMVGCTATAYLAVRKVLDSLYPDKQWVSEASFTCHAGFGGKIDLYSPDGIVVDFKTKDGIEGADAQKLVYDEHGLQLSAYAKGLGFSNPARVSIFIDRTNPEIVSHHVWDTESHAKHLGMFMNLVNYWQLSKCYVPIVKEQP